MACHVSAAGPRRGQCAILHTDLSRKSKHIFCIWDFRAIKGAVLSADAMILYTSEPGSRVPDTRHGDYDTYHAPFPKRPIVCFVTAELGNIQANHVQVP